MARKRHPTGVFVQRIAKPYLSGDQRHEHELTGLVAEKFDILPRVVRIAADHVDNEVESLLWCPHGRDTRCPVLAIDGYRRHAQRHRKLPARHGPDTGPG